MSGRNLRDPRARHRPGVPMAGFDALPKPLRHWLGQAALPWSVRSARRAWMRALDQSQGREAEALSLLSRMERATLRRGQGAVWAGDHPGP
ncbi:hypothetical protein FGG78_31600 [Thioclava sp. BHET1]|nr:hypothetical protein FGG78_31600 [Thioclava sp. BHET1]